MKLLTTEDFLQYVNELSLLFYHSDKKLHNTVNVLFLTGCRFSELSEQRFYFGTDNKVYLQSLKHSALRSFDIAQLPDKLLEAIATNDYSCFETMYDAACRRFTSKTAKLTLSPTGKNLIFHCFRHAYAKRLYFYGDTIPEISLKLGEKAEKNTQGYISSTVYMH